MQNCQRFKIGKQLNDKMRMNIIQCRHVNAICSRPEVADSGKDEKIFRTHFPVNFGVASFSGFPESRNRHLRDAWTTVGPHGSHFRVKKQKCLMA